MFLLSLAYLIHFAYLEESECKCWEGFAETNDTIAQETDYRCLGATFQTYNRRHYCNEPKSPTCECTNATSFVIDDSGVHCVQYSQGHELKRWDCENTEEWSNYNKNNEEFYRGRNRII